MEIRFCSVCNESIPDGEFDAGRAIVSGDRAQHVSCALQRSVRMGGARSWITFALALVAASIAVYLLALKLGEPKEPPKMAEVPEVVEQHVADALRASEARLDAAITDASRGTQEALQKSLETRLTQHGATVRDATVEAMDERLRVNADEINKRVRMNNDMIIKIHSRIADIVDWKIRIQREADQLRRDLEAAKEREPVPAPEQPAEETPETPVEPDEPAVDEQREKEIDTWIKRLRDADEDIVFSATIELARLKALRATPHLVDVLKKHKDFYARLGAATALGEIQAVAAVPALIEALNDRDDLVRTTASEALHRITGQDFNFVSGLTKNERIRIQKKWRAWWKDHETDVRSRLDQPGDAK